ncbi:hypothetical protein [Microvirga massiliensis]|uniref:hypothetical protein n=1 Tax=Microvirga massiliensis TaxID=1033741 RepID=UPI00062BCB12|nr:hypothetical protein [Microvirga massiliensis]
MAYGKGARRTHDKRMVRLGALPADASWLTLRAAWIVAANHFASRIRLPILDELPDGKDLDRVMLAAQAELKGRLSSVWAEKARISAKAAVVEHHRRARGNLFGRLKHLDTVGDKPLEDGTRRLVNLPEEWSRKLTDGDVAALKQLTASFDFRGALAFLRQVRDGTANLSALHADALLALVEAVEAKFRHPAWQDHPDTVVQLHLDFRCVPKGEAESNKAAWQALTQRLTASVPRVLSDGTPIVVPLLVAAPLARQAPLLVRAVLRQAPLQTLIGTADPQEVEIGSLCLELGQNSVEVKGVLSKKPRVKPLPEVTHLLARDFGYRNTCAFAVVRKDADLDEGLLTRAKDWSKAEAKAYLERHVHDGELLEALLLDGSDFLNAINVRCETIDALRSEIDRTYNRIGRIKANINRVLGRPAETLVDLATETDDRMLAGWIRRLQRLLAHVGRLKECRRREYRAIDGLKKSWFGYITSEEAALARQWNAAVVREHLTVMAEEKDSPAYKGRTFNRMINNGAKGQYIRRASNKLKWNGIPEVVVPSFWTSCTDVRFGVVDKAQRRGPVFVARADGLRADADLHAAHTLALWPLLRPKMNDRTALAA